MGKYSVQNRSFRYKASTMQSSNTRKSGIMDVKHWLSAPRSRRSVLQQLGVLAGVGLTGGLGVSAIKRAMAAEVNPISHVLIASQENRTFDTYFGRYPQAGHFGFPSNYAVPDG